MVRPVSQIQPIPLFRLFGAKIVTFSLGQDKLTAKLGNGPSYELLYGPELAGLKVSRGLIWSTISLPTSDGKKKFPYLPHKEARSACHWLRSLTYQKLCPEIEQAAHQIRETLRNSYLRSSQLDAVIDRAKFEAGKFVAPPLPDYLQEDQLRSFSFIGKIAKWKQGDVAIFRQRYVDRMINQFEDFFDAVESNPLTEKQREACVIDDDNNLVLAGAGTGKTSVMIGRAGFLLRSGQAQPGQILMLAFGNKAAKEMQERLDERLDASESGVVASTFHKLGKDIIAQVEGAQPSVSSVAEDDRKLAKLVEQWFEEKIKEKVYKKGLLKYFEQYMYPAINPFDFETEGEYFEYIMANDIRTLKGEIVKSVGECLIANFLFEQDIEYFYEADYRITTRTLAFRQYAPDFYLPQYDIYIEFFGIDRKGNTAPYVPRERYHRDMEWKRALHQEHETILIELYHYENMEGVLLDQLRDHLAAHEVDFAPLPDDAKLATLREFGAVSMFSQLLSQMLRLYRSSRFAYGGMEERVRSSANAEQLSAALELLMPVVKEYEAFLAAENTIDFDDMIGLAITYVQEGRFHPAWRFILVDEFQDISDPRARLVQAIKEASDDCSLFCVGDDWQAIYRFAGSDIDFTSHFSEHFGAASFTTLDMTFRFNNSISDVASRFVQENPAQLKKVMRTHKVVTQPAVVLYRETERAKFGSTAVDKRIFDALSHISERAEKGKISTVYLLARYWFVLPDANQVGELNRSFPNLDIQNQSIHASKGKEADYVVIVGLFNGKNGFPSKKVTHPLLEALLPPAEPFPFAEERRLFYVALTRAKARAYLIADMAIPSDFVVELIEKRYPIELDEFSVSLTQKLFQKIRCGKCLSGTMVHKPTRSGAFGRFLGCTNYPLCKNTEGVCPSCGQAMEHIGNFRVCIDPACRSWVPTCEVCGGDMVLRKSRYGEFWGCRNWRKQGTSCDNTKKTIIYEGPQPEQAN